MATDVIMPVLGMAQDSGTLVRWLKQPGQSVTRGEILFEVETDKAVQEIEAQADGVLGPWLAGEGAVVPVTQVVARLYAPGEAPVAAETPAPAVAAPKPPLVTASPLATRMAAAHVALGLLGYLSEASVGNQVHYGSGRRCIGV